MLDERTPCTLKLLKPCCYVTMHATAPVCAGAPLAFFRPPFLSLGGPVMTLRPAGLPPSRTTELLMGSCGRACSRRRMQCNSRSDCRPTLPLCTELSSHDRWHWAARMALGRTHGTGPHAGHWAARIALGRTNGTGPPAVRMRSRFRQAAVRSSCPPTRRGLRCQSACGVLGHL